MKEAIIERCELFIWNRDIVKLAVPWENSYFYPICASLFTDKGINADEEKIKECRKLLKSRVNAFSSFRGAAELSLVAMLAIEDEPERRLDEAMQVYSGLKEHFFSSEYLPVAAMILSGAVEKERYGDICERTRRIYDLMKNEHPFLTSSEDSVFAAMLALSDRDDADLINEIETCYNILNEKFFDKNAVQSLSHVLALADDKVRTAQEKCRDTIRLFDTLKEKKYKYGTGYELATLGVLATLPCGFDETVNDLIAAADYLGEQKGYGFFGMGKTMRMMHAGMIVTSAHMGRSDKMNSAALCSTLSLVAAQQAAVCAAIAASVAAANAARST